MPTKARMTDLQGHLFAQLERLGDESLESEEVEREVQRTKALVAVAGTLIDAGKLSLEVWDRAVQHGLVPKRLPKALNASGED